MWRLSDAFSARAAVAYRRHDIARSVADAQRRVEWVTGLLARTLAAAELERGCVMYQVSSEDTVYAVCTSPAPDGGLQRLRVELSRGSAARRFDGHGHVAMV